MTPLTIDTLRTLGRAQGLELADADLQRLLPLVQAGRAMMDELSLISLADVEPTSQYRIL